jgi:hypothetical protein
MLARLGAAADKRPRMPAKIGLGIMKKAKQREAVALQEAIAAGMVKAKGRGKKERAQKGEDLDELQQCFGHHPYETVWIEIDYQFGCVCPCPLGVNLPRQSAASHLPVLL